MDNKVVQTLARAFLQLGYRTRALQLSRRRRLRRRVGRGPRRGRRRRGGDRGCATTRRARGGRRRWSSPASRSAASSPRAPPQRLAEGARAERLVLVAPSTQRQQVAAVPADTLVIHGEADDVVPLSATLDWARPQSLPVTVVPGGGPFLPRPAAAAQEHRAGRLALSAPRRAARPGSRRRPRLSPPFHASCSFHRFRFAPRHETPVRLRPRARLRGAAFAQVPQPPEVDGQELPAARHDQPPGARRAQRRRACRPGVADQADDRLHRVLGAARQEARRSSRRCRCRCAPGPSGRAAAR